MTKKHFYHLIPPQNRSLWYVQKVSTAMFWFVFVPLSRPSRSLDSSQRPARLTFRFSCDSAWTILCKDGPDRVYHQIDHIRRDGFETHKILGRTPNFWLEKRRSTWNFRENFMTMTQGKMEMVMELIAEMIFFLIAASIYQYNFGR